MKEAFMAVLLYMLVAVAYGILVGKMIHWGGSTRDGGRDDAR